MAVAILATDGWIQHLPFQGGQRPSPYGQVDGTFQGLIAGDGDATGGNLTLSGRLSFDRKEDWVYIVGGTHTRVNALISGDVFEQLNTGPLIPTSAVATTVTNATYEYGGLAAAITANALTMTQSQGLAKVTGMPIFGDKKIPGIFLMYAAGWESNTDGATYVANIWGWIIKYESFFRNVRPQVG